MITPWQNLPDVVHRRVGERGGCGAAHARCLGCVSCAPRRVAWRAWSSAKKTAPFVKVEATKFTEVGIYGTETESMISDLVEKAVQHAEVRAREAARPAARERAIDRLRDVQDTVLA